MDHRSIIKEYVSSQSDIKKMEKTAHLLCDAMHEFHIDDKEKLHKLALKIHEVYDGPHFNEHFAKHAILEMHHKKHDGSHHGGEHFSITQAKQAGEKHSHKIGSSYNAWDVYVAINANYHDKCSLFKKWFPENYEEKIIEDAMEFYFMDDDAPKGKIWHYMNAMRKCHEIR